MSESMKSQVARVVRVLLAFILVFWGSFSVESLAFAQINNPEASAIEDHAEDELTDFAVYEVDPNPADDNETGLGERLAKASDEGDPEIALTFEAPGETRDIVAIPAWNGKKFAISDSAVEIANFVEWDLECTPADCATIKADKDNPGLATLTSNAAGEVTVTCALSNKAKKNLSVSEELGTDAEAAFKVVINEPTPVEPEVSKRVSELRVLDEQGNLLTGSSQGSLVLPKTAVGTPYTFKVEIKVSEISRDGAEKSETYGSLEEAREAGVVVEWSIAKGEDVAEINQDGVLTMLKEGAAIVHVDASMGSETVPADITVKTKGADDPGSGDEPEPTPMTPVDQGEANPQTVLKVVSNMRVDASDKDSTDGASSGVSDAGTGKNGKKSEGSAASSGSSASVNPSGASADPATETLEKDYTLADLEKLGVSRATYTMYGTDSKFITVTGEGPYLIALLRDLGIENTEQIDSITFENAKGVSTTVNWADFESANRSYPHAYEGDLQDSVSSSAMIALKSLVRGYGDGTGEGLDVGGEGGKGDKSDEQTPTDEQAPADEQVPADEQTPADEQAPADEQTPADEVSDDSPDAENVVETASEDSSKSSSTSKGTSSGASAPTGTTPREITTDVDLVDNTCMRILFGSTSPARTIADPDALRWVNKITVNVKPTEEQPEYDTDIDVSVEYVPVPLGAPAIFTALPNTEIKNARFDFQWEVSTNNGKTWKKVENGDVQGLRVVTTEKRLGNQYRVIMTTNAVDKNGLENVTVTSKPVTMVEGNGLAVVLEYDPPIAGQTAFFQTTLYGAKSGVPIEYIWQQSQDGGATWTKIRGRTGSSLAVPTEPIEQKKDDGKDKDKSDGAASDEDIVPITYIRVIAKETAGEEREAISQAVPLTVHVDDGKDGGDDSGKDPVKPGDPDPKPDKPGPSKPDKPATPDPPAVTPVEDITVEHGSSDTPQATPTVPTENGTTDKQIDPSKLYVNEEVTEKVNKQQEAVDEYIEATQPGARWTSLSSSQATGDDVRNILADNPFAPFVVPMGLGITVAGGLEKFLAFRRQTK